MRWLNLRVLSQVGGLTVLAAVLIPATLVVFGFLRRSLQPSNGGVEFLLVLASFFIAFFGLVVVIALAAALIALSVGYIQHVKDVRQQSPEVRQALDVIRRAEVESWSYARLTGEAPSLAAQVDEHRWFLGEEYFAIARWLGEQLREVGPLCAGHVFDVVFACTVRPETRSIWDDAEAARTRCPYYQGDARLAAMRDTLALRFESRGEIDLAKAFWELHIIRQADAEGWTYGRVTAEAPNLAVQAMEKRWILGEEYLEIAKRLGEQVVESVPLCHGHVVEVTFARPLSEDTRASWIHAESERNQCPHRIGNVRIEAINRSLAYWCVDQLKNEVADVFWHRLNKLAA